MLISTKGRYALRVLTDMAEHGGSEYIKLKDIAERQEISEKYLESIVKQLVKNKIVSGLRGKGGGYKLSKAPDEINAGEILRIMEGGLAPVACLENGDGDCVRSCECKTLPIWQNLDKIINDYLESVKLSDLINR